jgi:DNA-binding response OmpR family regulator
VSVVLLVDDEPEMEGLVKMCVEDSDARVVRAASLADAIARAEEERPSLVLLDLRLGDEDGLAILPRLREAPALAQTPIVAFTVHDTRKDEALEKGVDGFVAKPFRVKGLRAVIQEHLA